MEKIINENTATADLEKEIEDSRPTFTLMIGHKCVFFYKIIGGYIEEYEGGSPVFTSLSKAELCEYYEQ
jgi:hypothetical protein